MKEGQKYAITLDHLRAIGLSSTVSCALRSVWLLRHFDCAAARWTAQVVVAMVIATSVVNSCAAASATGKRSQQRRSRASGLPVARLARVSVSSARRRGTSSTNQCIWRADIPAARSTGRSNGAGRGR